MTLTRLACPLDCLLPLVSFNAPSESALTRPATESARLDLAHSLRFLRYRDATRQEAHLAFSQVSNSVSHPRTGHRAGKSPPFSPLPLPRFGADLGPCLIDGSSLQVGILLLVFPILRAVAVHTLSTSVLSVSTSNITRASNSSFQLTLEGQARKVGIFPAKLAFERPVYVHWIAPENLDTELQLGHFALEPIGVAAGHGRIKQQTQFIIDDLPGFTRFTECEFLGSGGGAERDREAKRRSPIHTDLITQESFTWRLKSESVQAKAFGFIAANKLSFVKVRLERSRSRARAER